MRRKSLGFLAIIFLAVGVFLPVAAFGATSSLKIGLPNQQVEDIQVTETKEEVFKKKGTLDFVLPKGVTFTSMPVVEVSDGDLKIDSIDNDFNSEGREYIAVKVKSESSVPSTIKISGIRLTVDRSVPDGPVYLELSGEAINETASVFPGSDVFKIQLGEVVGLTSDQSVAFSVGSQVYYDNGQAKVMDAVPYIKDSRTFVPLRFLLNAFGIEDEAIAFDNGKVTIHKGSQTIELFVGQKQMISDGKTVALDVSPEEQQGRVMLPVRAVAEILGAQVYFAEDQIIMTMAQ